MSLAANSFRSDSPCRSQQISPLDGPFFKAVPFIVAEDGIAPRVYLQTRGVLQNAAGGRPPIHFGREVSIYAFCGTLAAKVNLKSEVSSSERPFWPDGKD